MGESSELERLRARVSELEREAEGYRLMVETTNVVLWELDLASQRFTYVSPQAVELFGYPLDLWTDMNAWSSLIHPDDREEAVSFCSAQVAAQMDHSFDYRFLHADGRYLWIRDVVSLVPGTDGRPAALRGVFVDVTEQHEHRLAREQWFSVFDRAEWGLAVAEAKTRTFVYVNQCFARMHGGEPTEFIGQPIHSLYPEEDHEELQRRIATSEREGRVTFETHHRRKDGTSFPVRVTSSMVLDMDGRPIWRAATVVDLSDSVAAQHRTEELEEQLRQSQKLEAVGLLASGIAHDFNNHLTVILGCAELLRGELQDEALTKLARNITGASNAAAQVTNQLLAFAREQPREERILDLNRYLKATVELLERLLPEDIQLTAALHEGPLDVRADPAQIEQVVLNLALNARDAMAAAGGNLEIETRRGQGDAVLRIADDGTGMSPDVLARIFEPFFSTKPTVKGTGLGLATVHGIVEQNGWAIDVESAPGEGTTFALTIPLAVGAAPVQAPAPRSAEAEPVRILVAEDDDGVAAVVCKSLRAVGHEVERAVDGVDALEQLAASGPFDLLLSDVMMPRMRGGELLLHVRRDYPDLRILFMSGYSADELETSGERLLPKPFSPARLQAVVSEVLTEE